MRAARRLDSLPEYVFASLNAKLKALEARGLTIIRLDMGSPDGPPADFIIETLAESAAIPTNHGYSGFTGISRAAAGDCGLLCIAVRRDA